MSLNILVVDDSSTMRRMVAKTLQMSGLAVGRILEACNGLEALKLMETEWTDVVLTDINMPEMDGLEMIDQMHARSDLPDVPVVVISTESCQARIDQVRDKGVRFIHKPFTPEQVAQVLDELLERTGS